MGRNRLSVASRRRSAVDPDADTEEEDNGASEMGGPSFRYDDDAGGFDDGDLDITIGDAPQPNGHADPDELPDREEERPRKKEKKKGVFQQVIGKVRSRSQQPDSQGRAGSEPAKPKKIRVSQIGPGEDTV